MTYHRDPQQQAPQPAVPHFDVRDLIPHGDVAQISLDDQTYVLRITRAGKLILTK